MLTETKKTEIQELTKILTKLDHTGRTIMLSNAMVLLARQEVKKRQRQEEIETNVITNTR
ncbi:MAG: hypothetical protein HFJ09_10205 [Lachnospiraceae bacterium]|nr:hypothetical protein [Lachnospiraceae bacterium]